MGILGIGGSKKSEKSKSKSKATKQTKSTNTSSQTSTQNQTVRNEALTPGILEALEGAIGGQIEKLGSGERDFSNEIGAIVSAARLRGTNELEQNNSRFAQSIGSNLNSAATEVANRGATELETSLAGLEGQLLLSAAAQEDQQLSALAPVLSVLAGATSQQTTTGQQQVDLKSILSELVNATQSSKTKGKSAGGSIGFNL